MNSTVFMSHANADNIICQEIYDMLKSKGIEVWASFRDIPAGAHWDLSIQNALDLASHVLLVVSTQSVKSSYVRTEIEYALDNQKVVIPILIEQVKLPVRWHTLQFVDWTHRNYEMFNALVSQLPHNAAIQLQELLTNKTDTDLVRQLALANWQWFDMGALSSEQVADLSNHSFPPIPETPREHEYELSTRKVKKLYGFFNPRQLVTASFIILYDLQAIMQHVDFVSSSEYGSADRPVELVFLCSPHELFVRPDGTYSVEFQEKLQHARQIAVEVDKKRRMAFIIIRIISGQRDQFDDNANARREELSESWCEEMLHIFTKRSHITLRIESYTRLLDSIII